MIPQVLSLILAGASPSPIPLSTPLQIADADLPIPARYHHRHARHSRHHTRPHVRVRSDPPGVKWTEVPEAPEPEPHSTPPTSTSTLSDGAIRVRTTTMPATTPLLDSTRFFPPTIGPAQARAYCIAHGLECSGGASAPPLSHIPQ